MDRHQLHFISVLMIQMAYKIKKNKKDANVDFFKNWAESAWNEMETKNYKEYEKCSVFDVLDGIVL